MPSDPSFSAFPVHPTPLQMIPIDRGLGEFITSDRACRCAAGYWQIRSDRRRAPTRTRRDSWSRSWLTLPYAICSLATSGYAGDIRHPSALKALLDCARRIGSPDGSNTERPDLVGRLLFRGSACRTSFAFPVFNVMTVRARLLGELHQSSCMVMGGARVVRYHASSWTQRKNTRTSPSSHVISSLELRFARHDPSQADGVVMVHLPR